LRLDAIEGKTPASTTSKFPFQICYAETGSVYSSVCRAPPYASVTACFTAPRSMRKRNTSSPSLSIYCFLAERICGVGSVRQSFPCIPFSSSCFPVHAPGRIASSVSLLLARTRITSEMKPLEHDYDLMGHKTTRRSPKRVKVGEFVESATSLDGLEPHGLSPFLP